MNTLKKSLFIATFAIIALQSTTVAFDLFKKNKVKTILIKKSTQMIRLNDSKFVQFNTDTIREARVIEFNKKNYYDFTVGNTDLRVRADKVEVLNPQK